MATITVWAKPARGRVAVTFPWRSEIRLYGNIPPTMKREARRLRMARKQRRGWA